MQLGYRALFAPLYDPLVRSALDPMRRASLAQLEDLSGRDVLIPGIGTGLDIPGLPPGARYLGIELSQAMLQRARPRATASGIDIHLLQGDAMRLPLADASIDCVLMHFILAVVPEPARALAEASRVLRPGGRLVVVDKFLRPDERATLKRLLNPLLQRLATRTDVVFEALLAAHPELQLDHDQALAFGGWFRRLSLSKQPD